MTPTIGHGFPTRSHQSKICLLQPLKIKLEILVASLTLCYRPFKYVYTRFLLKPRFLYYKSTTKIIISQTNTQLLGLARLQRQVK